MIKRVMDRVWAFDLEWVPDPVAGRLLYDLPDRMTPREVIEVMWREGGATSEDPTPFLKLIRCRVVSIALVERRVKSDGEITVRLRSLPRDTGDPDEVEESRMIDTFLGGLGQLRPQLVGFHSRESDLRILVQRGVTLGLRAAEFCRRPEKPWEGVDYFARASDYNVDLLDTLAGFGRGRPSLHELATLSGIPGKMEVDGNQVADLWLEDRLDEIVRYNELDALTTYLVWLRVAHFAGHFSSLEYAEEQERLRLAIETAAAPEQGGHLRAYLEEWQRLRGLIEAAGGGRDSWGALEKPA